VTYEVVIPFRDRGTDPLRQMNLDCVLQWWRAEHDTDALVASDGRGGKQQFNRSAAYNRAVAALPEADGFVFAESDVLISYEQIDQAVWLSQREPGLVVPFTQYRALTPEASAKVRGDDFTLDTAEVMWTMDDGKSIGAINVVSRKTLEMVGRYDERFEGNWYDDDAMKIAFEVCCGPVRYVAGPAYHLWHRPGHTGHHLTPEDRAATAANKRRLGHYKFAARVNNVARIRQLTGGSS
jgi:hypothetical protein